MDPLDGRVAVITGAASGLGLALARLAWSSGMSIVLADVQREALARATAEFGGEGARLACLQVDVSRDEQVRSLAEFACERFGRVNLLVNNAGVGGGGYVWEASAAEWAWVLGVNLLGAAHGIRHFVPRMLAAEADGEPGHVVNVASVAGWLCAPLMGVYNASKHAVVALTETLHHDLRLSGSAIGTTLVCPAFFPTAIAQSSRNRPPELQDPQPPTASQLQAQQAMEHAVASGRIDAARVAEMVFDAVRAGRFYVFTHPKIVPSIDARFRAVIDAGAPADPYAGKPQSRPVPPDR